MSALLGKGWVDQTELSWAKTQEELKQSHFADWAIRLFEQPSLQLLSAAAENNTPLLELGCILLLTF